MPFKRELALYQQVAQKIRRELMKKVVPGECLPSDRELAARWNVSMRTVREALLVIEAEGRVERQHGRGTVVLDYREPVALYSEINLLHPTTPRFFGLVLNVVRERLWEAGYATRIYAGTSLAGQPGGNFTCPDLLANAQAGQLKAIVSVSEALKHPELLKLQKAGLPMVSVTGNCERSALFGIGSVLECGINYLADAGRRRIAMIGWDDPQGSHPNTPGETFAAALAARGLEYREDWCRMDLSFAWRGSAWEEFREIWFSDGEKPDALLVTDENYLPEVITTVMQMGIRVPQDLLVVSHQARLVDWSLPVPIARIEQNTVLFATILADEALAAIRGEPCPDLPTDLTPFTLYPVQGLGVHTPSAQTSATSKATR